MTRSEVVEEALTAVHSAARWCGASVGVVGPWDHVTCRRCVHSAVAVEPFIRRSVEVMACAIRLGVRVRRYHWDGSTAD